MRGIAALLVVAFHLVNFEVQTAQGPEFLFSDIPVLMRGSAGVDMFFVISGFIMVYITQGFQPGKSTLIRYGWSRASRIFPLWWIFAGLMAAYLFATSGSVVPETAGQTGALPYLLKSLLLIPQEAPIVLEVGWTLIHEMYFYLAFGLLLLLPRSWLVRALAAWGLIVTLFSLMLSQPSVAKNFAEVALSPLTLEFLMGALVAVGLTRGPQTPRIISVGVLISGLLIFILATSGPATLLETHPNWGKVILFGTPCALILNGVVRLELSGLRTPQWLQSIGDWSYALYLSHLFVLFAGGKVFSILAGKLPTGVAGLFDLGSGAAAPRLIFLMGGIIACVVVSRYVYLYVERPLIRVCKRVGPSATPAPDKAGLLARRVARIAASDYRRAA